MNNLLKSQIRIIFDLQGFQRGGNRLRGIGRYSLELVKAIIYTFPDNEYILFSNSSLYDFRNDFQEELNSKELNVIFFEWSPVVDINVESMDSNYKTFIAIQLRSYALSILNADIILLTSFFDGFRDNTLVDFDKSFNLPPTFCIIYDLIPLINPQKYLDIDEEYKYFYYKKINDLMKLDALLTISESSKREIQKYTKFQANKIFNISAACNSKLFNKEITVEEDQSINIKDFGKYFLFTGAIDPRKNLYFLLKAYSKLPIYIVIKHKLVLAGPFSKTENELIELWVSELNINTQNIIILGYVTDSILAGLYRNCYLFVYPSLHEGFGLPVLEAMSSGAPVITSNRTSLPEIVNLEAALFDPKNIKQLKELLIKSSVDRCFYNLLKSNSEKQKRYFSWQLTALKTIESFFEILNSNNSLSKQNKSIQNLIVNNQISYALFFDNLNRSNIFKIIKKRDITYLKRICSALDLLNTQFKKFIFSDINRVKSLNWRIEGPFDSNYSLSILNKNFALGLSKIGQDVTLFSTEGPGDFLPNSDFLKKNHDVYKLYKKSFNQENKICITSRNLYPPRVTDLNSVCNLLHAYGWEESSFPYEWVINFNNCLDGITVMSMQVKKILIDNGVFIPIRVCGLGIDHIKEYNTNNKLLISKKSFSFLHISSCFPRKGVDCLLSAYGNSFTNDDQVTLIIKTFSNPHNNVHDLLFKYKKANPKYPDVKIINEDLEDDDIYSLYQQCDALVAPSFGEGFNLTVAEAMKIGIPVITTSWGGQMDFCAHSNCWLIDYEFEYADNHLNLFSSVWARPSSDHLSQLMKDLYYSSAELRLSKIESAQKAISVYTWSKVAEENVNFISSLSNSVSDFPSKIGWISTWDSKCGIATYSEHLLSGIKEDFLILTPDSNNNKQKKVIKCWDIGNENLESLFDTIIENKITSIVIQFNYGFFEFKSFSNFIQKIYSKNINIIIFLHSTIDPQLDNKKRIVDIKESLSLCNRILVHSPSDLNRLKDIGLIDNVSLFPHGILDFEFDNRLFNKSKNIKKIFHFSTYGFCLPNKGFPELIEAIGILVEGGFECRLSLYTALYDSDTSLLFYNELVNLIGKLNLENFVKINTTFMSDEETLKKLSGTDLVVFPYQFTNESASGAVRQAISSFTPVAVTPLSIFDDVLPVVNKLPGCTPALIASGLKNWSLNSYGKSMTDEEIEWREQHSFKKLGYRLQGLIKGIEVNKIFSNS